MKKILIYLCVGLAASFATTGCDDKLTEEPKSVIAPDFFKTRQGFELGLAAAYAGSRRFWGDQDFFLNTVPGTDEFTYGRDLTGAGRDMSIYGSSYATNDSRVTGVWKQAYIFINTCNGLVDNAANITDLSDAQKTSMVAEARFLRANYYFILVQLFGDITLNRNFNLVPTTSAVRNSAAEVYDFIVEDLQTAIANLPAAPKDVLPGKASAAAARHLLAKVYLTRAGSKAAQADDYKNAHTLAVGLINDRAALGLGMLQDYGQVHKEGNERSTEVLWTVQHTTNLAYNGSEAQNSSAPDNMLNHLFVPVYQNSPGLQRSMDYGRPYCRVRPTPWLLNVAFQERVNDTRYSKTFQTLWISNLANDSRVPKWTQAEINSGYAPASQLGKAKFALGDTAVYMPGYEVSAAKIAATRYKLVPPSKYTLELFPTVVKYFDTKRVDINNPSIRPVIVYRLAETYLIAAEALLMDGRAADAVQYVNAVRARAAYPTGDPLKMQVQASDLTVDFILDERTRELCGENMRWLDLVRTGKLLTRVKADNPDAAPNIVAPKHLLRPIPQAQIDGVITGEPYLQNDGWLQ
ncbi:RagB/SusD family nutrient uptake outer membrane protein [Fulvivirgaceae bacterium PWU4]|uniref:RagB/SusD family nutrient uptake outer membrane protein n=1 Tax=Chryseosolibacter histidini TaxID=2782349 RepID=A0AAP2DN35_9BACT|nr:RagB/SusD family nutrient uptake outer membrane protein [Chryseosolibacter histidini]MBT1699406.1 RagB/SusD family nutrient uptake outer membrane protein [Chryseosolibacter histidini]